MILLLNLVERMHFNGLRHSSSIIFFFVKCS